MAEMVGIAEKLPLEEAPPDVPMWHAITTGSVLYRIGLQPPPLIMQYVPSNRTVSRPFFQLFIPPTTYLQKENCLFCRRKTKQDTLRISLDPHNMGKRNNPLYCGKVARTFPPSGQSGDKSVWDAKATERQPALKVYVEKLGLQQNIKIEIQAKVSLPENEMGAPGTIILTGVMTTNAGLNCLLSMQGSDRPVLVLKHEIILSGADDERQHEENKYLLDFDYPLSIYSAFSIACVLESYRLR